MRSRTGSRASFAVKSALVGLALVFIAPISASGTDRGKLKIAMLPIWDRSANAAPVGLIREDFAIKLGFRGFSVLSPVVVEQFMRRHRIRFTGGITGEVGRAFREEVGVGAVLLTTVDLYREANPPRLAMTARLVTATSEPRVLWMESAVRTGDESPGLLGLGLITDPNRIREKVLTKLADSFSVVEAPGSPGVGPGGARRPRKSRRFRPRVQFESPDFPDLQVQTERIAVLPFTNETGERYAGEIVSDQVVRHLVQTGADVIEPGVVRQVLLEMRQIYTEGPSTPDTDILRLDLGADVALFGNVDEYEETGAATLYPVVDFTFRAVDTRSQETVWASYSHSRGNDGVFFFDAGAVPTAHELSSKMVSALIARAAR